MLLTTKGALTPRLPAAGDASYSSIGKQSLGRRSSKTGAVADHAQRPGGADVRGADVVGKMPEKRPGVQIARLFQKRRA